MGDLDTVVMRAREIQGGGDTVEVSSNGHGERPASQLAAQLLCAQFYGYF